VPQRTLVGAGRHVRQGNLTFAAFDTREQTQIGCGGSDASQISADLMRSLWLALKKERAPDGSTSEAKVWCRESLNSDLGLLHHPTSRIQRLLFWWLTNRSAMIATGEGCAGAASL
jgi:hypothetical protein